MPNVFAIAQYILNQLGAIEALKLQKLVYYCQAWSLAWTGNPLFPEQFQAWANGPVCRELYDAHWRQYMVAENDVAGRAIGQLTAAQRSLIENVLEFYSRFSPQQLSDQTHSERPWINTRQNAGVGDGERANAVIDENLMREYYQGLVQQAN